MAIPAVVAGAAVAAVGVAGFSAVEQSRAAKTQSILDESAINLNTQQAKTQAAESAALNARNFRQALASQVSLAGMRGGAGSIARQFGAESVSNFLQDQKAISAGMSLADIQALHSRAQSSANRRAANIGATTGFANAAIGAINLNAIGGTGGGGITRSQAQASQDRLGRGISA